MKSPFKAIFYIKYYAEKHGETIERKAKKAKDTPLADDKVNEIRDEVLEALNRLEQMDVEEWAKNQSIKYSTILV